MLLPTTYFLRPTTYHPPSGRPPPITSPTTCHPPPNKGVAMRRLVIAVVSLAVLAGIGVTAQRKPYRGVNDTYAAPQFMTRAGWNIRAAHLRELVLASAGLLPMPDRTPLGAQVFGDLTRPDYIVSKVYFE